MMKDERGVARSHRRGLSHRLEKVQPEDTPSKLSLEVRSLFGLLCLTAGQFGLQALSGLRIAENVNGPFLVP